MTCFINLRQLLTCPFPRNHIPLFGRGHQHLSLGDFLLGQLHISSQLLHHNPDRRQLLAEIGHHLRSQRLHGTNVHDLNKQTTNRINSPRLPHNANLEIVFSDQASIHVRLNLVDYRQQSYVSFSGACGGANQHVLVSVVRHREHL
jgi:hypothetical protein